MPVLKVYNFGDKGVNVDSNPIRDAIGELLLAQNVIHDPAGTTGAVVNRPGLTRFSDMTAGAVLGGIGVPLADERGERHLFIAFNADFDLNP